MTPKDVGRAPGFGPTKTHACHGQLRFVQVDGAIHARLQALGNRLFHLLGLGFILL